MRSSQNNATVLSSRIIKTFNKVVKNAALMSIMFNTVGCIYVACLLCIVSANTTAEVTAGSSLSFDECCTVVLTLTKACLLIHKNPLVNCKLEISPSGVLLQSWGMIRGMFHWINWVSILMTYCLLCNSKQLCHTVCIKEHLLSH